MLILYAKLFKMHAHTAQSFLYKSWMYIWKFTHEIFFVDDFWKHEIKVQQHTTPEKYFQQFDSPFLALQ